MNDNMDLAEDFIQYVIKYTWTNVLRFEIPGNSIIRRREIKTTSGKKRNGFIGKINFVLRTISNVFYTEAIDILRECAK
jgi:asparaginyl-tRNA synthetase